MDLRKTILAVNDLKTIPVEVPEWGVTVHIKSWSGKDRRALMPHTKTPDDIAPHVFVASVCNEAGDMLFTEADIPQLLGKNGAIIDRIATLALSHNGIGTNTDAKKN